MNGNSSIANLLFVKRDQAPGPAPAPMTAPDTSFQDTLRSSMAARESTQDARPIRENRRDERPVDRRDTPARDEASPREPAERTEREPAAKEKPVENSEQKARQDARESRDNNRPETDERNHQEEGWEGKDRPDEKSTAITTEAKDSGKQTRGKKDLKDGQVQFIRDARAGELKQNDSSKISSNDEQTGFLHDVLGMSLAAARETAGNLKGEANREAKQSSSTAMPFAGDAGKNAAAMKSDADTARTIESMVAGLMGEITKGAGRNRGKQAKGTDKGESNEAVRETGKQRAAKEPVVKVELDESKWKVAGDVARESQSRTGEFKIDSEPGKYTKNNVRGQRVPAGETRVAPNEVNREVNTEARTTIESGVLRRETSVDPRRAAAEQKAHLADNRKAFNELVEKARLNLGPNGRSSASMRLNPAHLGRMTINLQMNQNHLQAKVLVENQEARRMLMDDMEFLQREMRLHGIQIESFSIRVREPQSAQDATNQHADNKGGDANPAGGEGKHTGDRESDEPGDSSGRDNNEITEDSFETVHPRRKDAGLVNISV